MRESVPAAADEQKLEKKYCFLTKLSLFLPRLHTLNYTSRLKFQSPRVLSTPSGDPTVQFPVEDSNSIDIRVLIQIL